MAITHDKVWHRYPKISLPSPVLALAPGSDGIWVGGTGGIAWMPAGGEWQSRISGLPLLSVTALEYTHGQLIAGGADGIARSSDEGITWQRADLEEGVVAVTALASSPDFRKDHTVIAATLESGILRTEDSGKTWYSATFGLQCFEINALVWGQGEMAIAATSDGLYRSSNGGRAWRFVRGSEGLAVSALVYLKDGSYLATTESGELLRSTDGGTRWQPYGELAADIQISAIDVTPEGALLLGTTQHGLLRSTTNGTQWKTVLPGNILSLASDKKHLYVGTGEGVSISVDDGETWQNLPYPPIHDLRKLHILDQRPFLSGIHAGLLQYSQKGDWEQVEDIPYPLTASSITPGGALLAAGLTGLLRSTDQGKSWQSVIPGEPGNVTHFGWRADGVGCAGSVDGLYLYRTADDGQTWQPLKSPLGVLPLAALMITEDSFIAVSYDPRQFRVHVWRSLDQGETWERELEAQTSWPLVETNNQPPLITMADSVLLQESHGVWKQVIPANGGAIRRVVRDQKTLWVFTTAGLLQSTNAGKSWVRDEAELPINDVLDIAVSDGQLYVLLIDGRVWSRSF